VLTMESEAAPRRCPKVWGIALCPVSAADCD
jgi:hypothetical protein